MSRIDDLIKEHVPNGVQFKALGELGEFIRGNGLQKSELADAGFPAIHYGQIHTHYGTWATATKSFTDPETAAKLRRARPGDLIIATTSEDDAAVAKATAWVGPQEVAVSGDAYIYRHSLDPRYVAYFFQAAAFQSQKLKHVTGTKVRRVSGGALAKIRIPVPPLEVQREVVRILDHFTALEAELEAELEARRRQYVHYRARLVAPADGGEMRPVILGDAVEMQSGQFIAAREISSEQDSAHPYPCYGGNGVRGFVATHNREGDAVLIGRQGALSGNVKRVSGKFYATEHAIVATADADIEVRWLFHMLSEMNLNQYVSQGAQPGLAVGNLRRVPMVIPALEEQRRAAGVLDRLDALVSDLSMGIPAELNARRKQYEYYRDQLLTFPEAVA